MNLMRNKKGMGRVYLDKAGVFYIADYYVNNYRFRYTTNLRDYNEAFDRMRKDKTEREQGAMHSPKVHKITIRELLDDLFAHYEIKGFRSLPMARQRADKHLIPYFGFRRHVAVGPGELAQYTKRRLKEEAMPATINRELSLLRTAYNRGIVNGKVIKTPAFTLLEENNVRQGFYEDRDFELLLRELPDEIVPVARFAKITGWRKGEILNLQWWQVDFAARMIRLEPGTTKNRAGRQFAMTADLYDLLMAQRGYTESVNRFIPWVFHRQGVQIKDFSKAWENAHERAKLPLRLFHDLRRTAIRNFVRRGISEHIAMRLSGHKSPSVFRRYDIVTENDLREAAAKLDEQTDEKKKVKE